VTSLIGECEKHANFSSGSTTDVNTTNFTQRGKRKQPGPQTILTFNFSQQDLLQKEPLQTATEQIIEHSTVLEFPVFADLFKSFLVRSRKDLKDLFEQLLLEQSSSLRLPLMESKPRLGHCRTAASQKSDGEFSKKASI